MKIDLSIKANHIPFGISGGGDMVTTYSLDLSRIFVKLILKNLDPTTRYIFLLEHPTFVRVQKVHKMLYMFNKQCNVAIADYCLVL